MVYQTNQSIHGNFHIVENLSVTLVYSVPERLCLTNISYFITVSFLRHYFAIKFHTIHVHYKLNLC